ncbi:hypothetical protein BDY24DRAFT_395721 [Mrakia frigida]|uniref:uncharacterized protein n=1 Tax=Mrakia frigida TaxID=29902 RepID=UPI003FCC0BBC
MAPQPRRLTSLPSDVLHEILGFTLDEPNGLLRAAVLSTCSLLHEVGSPLLFQHVRLATFSSWESMFGVGGILSSLESGGKGMGKFVKELELDRLDVQDSDWSFSVSSSLHLPSVHTLTLSHHLVETWTLHPSAPWDVVYRQGGPTSQYFRQIPPSLFSSIFIQLPSIHSLRYLVGSTAAFVTPPSSGRSKYHTRQAITSLLGLTQPYNHHQWPLDTSPTPSDPFPFPLLRKIHFVGGLQLDDPRGVESVIVRGVAFAMLPMIETLVVEFHKDENSAVKMDSIYRSLIVGSMEEERETRWKGLKRLEIRRKAGGGKAARLVESRLRLCWEKSRKGRIEGTDSCELRLTPLVVFVDEDGKERRLIE